MPLRSLALLVTLAALWIFAGENLDVAILEVGMGGRLDAVNIVDADASIVVSVDLDHQSYLGDTIEKIGLEKAHIYRQSRPAIFADVNPPQSLLSYAAEIGADLRLLNRDYRYSKMESQWQFLGRDSARHSLPFPALRGGYQLKNASGALAALEALHDKLPVAQNHIKRGLLEVEWPGRMQVLAGRPTVVLDVAHNPHAARALQDALGTMGYFENTIAVFGMLKDKDIDQVIDIIKGRIDFWCVAGLEKTAGERGATSAMLAQKLVAHGVMHGGAEAFAPRGAGRVAAAASGTVIVRSGIARCTTGDMAVAAGRTTEHRVIPRVHVRDSVY